MRRPWRTGVLAGIASGIVVGAFAMAAAWDHNPQGEFHDAGGIHWVGWLAVGLGWFLPVTGGVSVLAGALAAVVGRLVRKAPG